MSTKIFVMTHKLFEGPKDSMYVRSEERRVGKECM